MLKLILKSLWARRRRNVWIILELILITIVAWVVLDPAIVTGYNLSLQPGYDIDRLVSISLSEIPEKVGTGCEASPGVCVRDGSEHAACAWGTGCF